MSTVGGALVGLVIGQSFNGSTTPMVAGFTICGALGLAVAHWANAGLPPHARNESAELSERAEAPLG